jgi:hypothetical protein
MTLILLAGALGMNGLIYRRKTLNFGSYVGAFRRLPSLRARWFVLVLLLILAVQLSPLVGLWVTPGDDAKLYSLISLRVVESQGIPRDWGIFASPNWYVEHTHLLLPGFSSEVAFLTILFSAGIPSTVSIIASLFRSLTAASLYVFVWILTGRRMPAALTMAVYGLLMVEPTFAWFAWGGMAELAAISILPLATAGTYLLSKEGGIHWRLSLWTALLIGGMSLLHPFAFFYYLVFLVSLSLVLGITHNFSRAIRVWLPTVVSLALVSGPILNAFASELSISQVYSTYNPAWTPTLTLSMSISQALYSLIARYVAVYGAAATSLLFVGLVASRRFLRPQKEVLAIVGSWYVALFLLHENNPNGLFVIPFPLWYRIDSNRTFAITSLVVAIVVGLIVEPWIRRFRLRLHFVRSGDFRGLSRVIRSNRRRSIIAGLAIALAISQAVLNTDLVFAARSASPVGAQDIAAFDWVKTQTPIKAVFFVNWADAGGWIPAYAGRSVVMPFGVITNYSLLQNYTQAVASFIQDPTSRFSVEFMKSTGVTYIYSGPGRIYGRQGFDPGLVLTIPQYRSFTTKARFGFSKWNGIEL